MPNPDKTEEVHFLDYLKAERVWSTFWFGRKEAPPYGFHRFLGMSGAPTTTTRDVYVRVRGSAARKIYTLGGPYGETLLYAWARRNRLLWK